MDESSYKGHAGIAQTKEDLERIRDRILVPNSTPDLTEVDIRRLFSEESFVFFKPLNSDLRNEFRTGKDNDPR